MHAADWPALRHAYGPAADVPGLLRHARRAPAPADHQDEPWFSLWSALCHQGDVYPASYAAVPELIAIAEARDGEPAAARECLLLAGCIEMYRAMPYGPAAPPPMPPELAPAYADALRRGAALAARHLAEPVPDEDARESLLVSHAALRGDAAEARRLSDPPEEDA